jgi:hypothetical protein
LLSDNDEQASPFMYCKDYVQDAIQGRLLGRAQAVYGFSYDPKAKAQPSLTNARFILANSSDPDMEKKIPNLLDFLHQFEEKLGIPRTKVQRATDPPKKYIASGAWVITGSDRWLKSPIMISLYTLLLRVGFSHEPGTHFFETIKSVVSGKIKPYQSADTSRMVGAIGGIEKILAKGDQVIWPNEMKENYPAKIEVYNMHNTCGIMGWTSGSTKSIMPEWHKD